MSNKVTVVDARMGRGKSSAAIRYMNQYKGVKKFLYITPYLDEVNRICEKCDFDQSDNDYTSKSNKLKELLKEGKDIAATHALFYLMDKEAIEIVASGHYTLIIDESIQVIERLNISKSDFEFITKLLTIEKEGGSLSWNDSEYIGRFSDYKDLADAGFLFRLDSALLNIMSPELIRAFDEIFMLTYLFDGQYQKAYLDYFGFEYNVIGIDSDEKGYYFADHPDNPSSIDYRSLINIVDNERANQPGEERTALSKSWFSKRGYDDPDIKKLRNGMKRFFQNIPDGNHRSRLWTSFKDSRNKLIDKNGRFRNNFLQVAARATNEYRDRTDIAYMANRFIDPNLSKFFAAKGITIDADKFALGEMLQWIWRSAIRDDKPINLYIPSSRMRNLLINWIDDVNQGGNK